MLDELLWQQHILGLQELLLFIHLKRKRMADNMSYKTQPESSGSLRLQHHPHRNKACLLTWFHRPDQAF